MKIDSRKVKDLRDKTGAGVLACQKALQRAGGDGEKAVDILRAEGLARAAKREGREARQGIIQIKVGKEAKKAALLELNCETDFVARTSEFRQLAGWLLEEVYRRGSEILTDKEVVQRVKAVAGVTGEKIAARRALVWEKEGFIAGYLHHNALLAVMVELSRSAPEVGREIAMQIAVSNPEYISEDEIPSDLEQREKDIFRAQFSDKPVPVREKIVEGKWRKRLTEICLLDHPYMRDPEFSVRNYLEKQGKELKVRAFARWRLGEE